MSEDTERKWRSNSKIKERTYDINLAISTMPRYDPLADEHLQDYFNAPNARKHLLKLGLIDEEGNIVNEKKFKKNQIQLDKKAHENRLLDEQMQREMDHNIQVYKIDKVALRLQAKQTIEKRGRLKNPGEGLPENILKYPISMQTTAMIYTSSVTTGERKRSKSATTTRQVPKVTRPMTGKARPQTSGSVLKLFESARMDYKHGEWKRAEDGLKELLSKVSQQGGPDVKNTKRMSSRPKSARPTRHSAFPVSSAFSECDSDGDADLVSDTELEKIFGEDVTREVVGKSTVPGLDSKRKQERSPSRAQSRPSSPKKKVVTIPQPQPVLKEEGKAEKPIVVKEKPLVASKVDKPVVAKEKPRAQSALKKEPAKVEKPVVKSVPQAVPKAEKPVVKEKATVKPVPSKAPKEQNEVTKPVPKAQEKVVETVDEDIPEAITQEVKEKEPDVPIEDSYGDDFETEKVPLKDEKSTGNLAKEPTSKSNLSKSNPSLAHIDSNKSTQSLGRSVPDLQKSSGSVKNASKPVTPKSSTSQLKSQDKLVNKESVGKDVKKSSVDLKKSNQALARSVPELAKSQEPLKDSNETKAEPMTETAKSSSNLKKSSPAIARSVPELSKSQEPLKDSKESKSEPTTEQVKSTSNLKKSNQSLSRSVPELSKSAKASQQKLGSQPALQKSTENVEKTSKSPEDPKEAVVNQEPETERKPSRPVSARQSRDQLDQSPIPVRPTSARQSQANLSDPSEPQKSNPELKKSDPHVTKSTSKLSRSTDKLAPEGQKAVAMKSSLANLTDQSKKSQPDLKTSQYTFDNNGISKSVKDIYGVSSRKSSTKDVKRSVEEVKADPVVAPVESKPQELEKEDSNDSFAIVRSTIGMGEDELPVQPQVPLQKAASKSSVHEIPLQKAASVKMEPVVQKQASQESIESEGGSMEIVRSTIGMGEDELPKEPLQRTLSVKFSDQLVIGATGSKTNLAGPSDPIDRKSSLKKSTNELSKPIGSEEDVTAQDGEISLVVPLQPIKQEDPLTARKVAMEEPRLAKGASLKRKQMRAVTELEAEEEYQPRSNTTPNRFTSITRDELEQTIET